MIFYEFPHAFQIDRIQFYRLMCPGDRRLFRPNLFLLPFDGTAEYTGNRLGYRPAMQDSFYRITGILGLGLFPGVLRIINTSVILQFPVIVKDENMRRANRSVISGTDFRITIVEVWKIKACILCA